ncbi:sulfatase and phosphatidylinositolglycan class N domain-containing protein [Perilla frutescens var. hirtella]|nr:sulfatase and phosphatidylinositolglycan class N domain-containing protein [Perilla frutescens var. hirtella]
MERRLASSRTPAAPVKPRFSAPTKCLLLLVADGLRADKFFEPDSNGSYRAPFLRSVIKEHGCWGVSHTWPPTESRPGHVAIITGFYEDPSAVTKGWKANPVEFDSMFNRSRHTFAFGSPDIIPIFYGALQHSTWKSYPHEYKDFATDASFLDKWSLDQFEGLLNRSNEDVKLKQLLQQDKGSHGDGYPSNTDIPLVAWGADVRPPMRVSENHHHEHTIRFVDDHNLIVVEPGIQKINDITVFNTVEKKTYDSLLELEVYVFGEDDDLKKLLKLVQEIAKKFKSQMMFVAAEYVNGKLISGNRA